MTAIFTRVCGVELAVLNFDAVLSAVTVEDGEIASTGFGPYALAEHNDTLYVVCAEGVGWVVTDDEPFTVDVYVSKPGRMAIWPSSHVALTPAEVRACVTTEMIDLVDLVRTFGGRLESNFWRWHNTLTA